MKMRHRLWGFASGLILLSLPVYWPGLNQEKVGFADYVFSSGRAADLRKDSTWLRDLQGRFVLLRGVNLMGPRSKYPPFLPVAPLYESSSFTTCDENQQFEVWMRDAEPEFKRLRMLGVNVVRLPIMWQGLEPTPNPNLDQLEGKGLCYLEYVKKIADALYAQGMFVFLDFHQDIASVVYGGDGFPDWALGIDKKHPRPKPPSPSVRWGLNYDSFWWPLRQVGVGRYGPLVRNTLQSFWNNQLVNQEQSETERVVYGGENPRTHFVKTIGQVAKFFAELNDGAGHPAIIGYEPFNEPSQVGLGKQNFEQNILPRFYSQVDAEIRKYDSRALLFIEPRVDWTTYSANGPDIQALNFTKTPHSFLPVRTADGDVFSFHYYDPWMFVPLFTRNMDNKAVEWPIMFRRMHAEATSRELVPFLTEFGCDHNWETSTDLRPDIYNRSTVRACIDLLFQQVESQLLNETYWNYNLHNSVNSHDNWNNEDFSLLGPDHSTRNLDIVARPYPMRSSAQPQRVFFDLGSKNAAFILLGSVVDSPTVIFVPHCMQGL
jgi:Cellulase (glycosyl hydrolase family 5)